MGPKDIHILATEGLRGKARRYEATTGAFAFGNGCNQRPTLRLTDVLRTQDDFFVEKGSEDWTLPILSTEVEKGKCGVTGGYLKTDSIDRRFKGFPEISF